MGQPNTTDSPETGSPNNKKVRNRAPRKEGKRYILTTENERSSSTEVCMTVFSWILVVIFFPIAVFFCMVTVSEYTRVIIFRLGRLRKGIRGPGLVWTLPCIDTTNMVDLRTRAGVIPSQDVITKDSVTINVDAVLFYCIEHTMHATIQISNVHDSTFFIAQTTLRNMVGSKTLHELLTSREQLSKDIAIAVDHATEKWGVRIERVDIKDISLPESLQRTLASEAEALREARAKIISAEGELNASVALKEASDVMAENKITLQLRHLQILTSISQERHLKIIYPFPLEMMSAFEGGGRKKGGAAVQTSYGRFLPSFSPNTDDCLTRLRSGEVESIEELPTTSGALILDPYGTKKLHNLSAQNKDKIPAKSSTKSPTFENKAI